MRKHVTSLGMLLLASLFFAGCASENSGKPEKKFVNYVDPMIGTGFHGHTFPGAVVPFGRVQLSPDTHLDGWDASSGYHYGDSTIYGFSHTHLSGTGIGDMGDVLFLPFSGDIPDETAGTFSHDEETATPGYYSVMLDPWGVKCELSATKRSGWHRYTFPQEENAGLLIDLGHILQPGWGHQVIESSVEVLDNQTIEGYRMTSGWAEEDPVWFRAEFDKSFEVKRVDVDGEDAGDVHSAEGTDVKMWLSFGRTADPVGIRVTISSVDREGPRHNMEEIAGLNSFDEVTEKARKQWEHTLSAIKIESDDDDVLTNFYTALYHSYIAPVTFSDADGRYRGMDREIHETGNGKASYTVYSLWDTFRAWYPLMTILEPEKSAHWVYDLYEKSEQGELLPKWELLGNYTGTMVGYPSLSLMADAMTKGLLDSIPGHLIDAAVRSATWQPEWHEQAKGSRAEMVMPRHIKYKEQMGFVPMNEVTESVSYGLEMAYYDWCLAQMAEYNGNEELAREWREKGRYYKKYFDEATGFMRGLNSDGSRTEDFNPNYSSHMKSEYVEGNAWQWSPFVPHDIEGFRELLGGKEAMGEWLDKLFTAPSDIEGEEASADITGLIGQYAHGNEPSHHVAYMYNYTDRPWRTEEVVDSVLYNFYLPEPAGIIGNEDCGQMSAWYVMSALGFYQMAPGEPVYTTGRPVVDEAEIQLNDGVFTIKVHNNSKNNKYVEEVKLDGEILDNRTFRHDDIQPGSVLEFFMTADR